jgi:hypothetical protein
MEAHSQLGRDAGESTPPRRTRRKQHSRRRTSSSLDKAAAFYANMLPPADPAETHFRHSGWADKRRRVRAALAASGANTFALNRFDECGCQCQVEWSAAEQRYRLRASYCHSRHCEPCMRAKATTISVNMRKQLEAAPDGRYRFVTLTLKHTADPLTNQIRHLVESFRRLRNSKWWKKRVVGGLYALEIKHSPSGWHPHLHLITEGSWLDQRELSDAWHKATGSSTIVDVRALANARDAAFYVTKYVTKGTNAEVWHTPDTAIEYVVATKGVRCVGTFARWRGLKLTAPPPPASDWKPIGKLTDIIAAGRRGETWAEQLLIAIRRPDVLQTDTPPPEVLNHPEAYI